jgi:hypothetical protein
MASNIVRFDPIRSIAFGSITNSYQNLGIAFGHAMRVLHFINNTDGVMMISFDGINDNIVVVGNTFSLYDLTAQEDTNEMFRYEKGSQLKIKYITAPTTGTFYVVAVYGKGE